MIHPSLCVLVVGLAVAGPVAAQSASFAPFGAGCAGKVGASCLSNNATNTALDNQVISINPRYGIQIKANTPLISGFELFTKAATRRTLGAYIYLVDASGKPQVQPFATGTITVDTTPGWYRARFPNDMVILGGSNTTYFLSWDNGKGMTPLISDPLAKTGTAWTHFHQVNFMGQLQWFGPFSKERWAFRVNCIGQNGSPALSAAGLPALGNKNFAVELSMAGSGASALLAIGTSKTNWGGVALPFDLALIGAPKCNLLAAPELLLAATADAQGNAATTLSVPRDSRLVGVQLHFQWGVVDPAANAMGMKFSNGGTAVVGN